MREGPAKIAFTTGMLLSIIFATAIALLVVGHNIAAYVVKDMYWP